MRRIVHISDIHFGNNDPSLFQPLRDAIEEVQPHVLVASGDFVEHATVIEFQQARAFLDQLPKPQITVPGNHDLAFYNLYERFFIGLQRYKKYIAKSTCPEYIDDEIAIVGANTSRFLPIRGGSLSLSQLDRLESQFSGFSDKLVRVLVTHHPFDLPENQGSRLIVGHARRAVAGLAPVVDILMAGHIHLSSTGSTATRYKTQGHAIGFVQAGTAVSNRNKGEDNSFNVLTLTPATEGDKAAVVDRYSFVKSQNRFIRKASVRHTLDKEGWAPDTPVPTAEVQEVGPSSGPPAAIPANIN